MKKILFSCALTLLSSLSDAAAAIRFEDLPDLVRQRNLQVSAAESEREAAQTREGLLERSFLPELDGYAGIEKFRAESRVFPFQRFGGLQARLNLFDGFRDYFQDRALEATTRLKGGELSEARAEELLKARLAFWELAYQRQVAALLSEAIEANDRHLASARQRVRAGLATNTDLLEFRMFGLQLTQELQRAKLAASAAEKTLAALIGSAESIVVDSEIPHVHDDPLRKEVVLPEKHWSYSVLQAESEIQEARFRAQRNWWSPSLDLYGGYELFTFREEDEPTERERTQVYAGVRLTIPLFDRFSGSNEARAARLETKAALLRAQQTSLELGARAAQIRTELMTLHETLLSMEAAVPLSGDYLTQTLGEYRRGVKNSPDVLGAAQKNLDIRRRVIDLKRDYQVQSAQLMAFLGR